MFTIAGGMRILVAYILLLIFTTGWDVFVQPIHAVSPFISPAQNADEIIVKYKPLQSPDELTGIIRKRQEKHKFLAGRVRIIFEDLQLKLTGIYTPEEQLAHIQSADASIGVAERGLLVVADDQKGPLYILKLDGTRSLEAAVELYRRLPEVEFAEPNFFASVAGV